MSSIPLDDAKEFEKWIMKVWQEKEDLLNYFDQHGSFPADPGAISESSFEPKQVTEGNNPAILNTEVQLGSILELWHLFSVLLVAAVVTNLGARFWNLYHYGTFNFYV